jgi:ATP-dependent Zn protease
MINYKLKTLITLLSVLAIWNVGRSQEKETVIEEIKAEVPELSKFHEVIYPLWHTAWPEKNIKMLAELLPEIENLSAGVMKAKLSGILREKQNAWNNGLTDLGKIISEYKSATSPIDSQKLLSAAERLHTQYERLVRVIRPALKEIDAFHSVLYMLYHYYLPNWEIDKIKTSVAELKVKMDLLNKAELAKRHETKRDAFNQVRKELDTSVRDLVTALNGSDKELITKKIEAMHTQYQALDQVFQ